MRALYVLMSVFALSACEPDKTEGEDGVVEVGDTACDPTNAPPYAVITSHADGDPVPDGEITSLGGVVGDADHDLSLIHI